MFHKKKNLLVPKTYKFITFLEEIKQKIGPLTKDETLFFFVVGGGMVKQELTMEELYQKYKNDDGFLYIEFSENSSLG